MVGVSALMIGAMGGSALAQGRFEVVFPSETAMPDAIVAGGVSGRLVVYLIAPDSGMGSRAEPADGPFFENPQPMFGVDVAGLKAGGVVVVDDKASAFPNAIAELAPGTYRAQAVLDTQRLDSSWRREPGNYFSEVATFEVKAAGVGADANAKEDAPLARLELKNRTAPRADEPVKDGETVLAETFSVRSELLSAFRGREVMMRAGVAFPKDHEAGRSYAAVYEVPGFGGNHRGAGRVARQRSQVAESATHQHALARSTFWIVLDPEGPNGHTLFADSENNGPCGRALVEELIPALEKKYNLKRESKARLLRGHSSGGWSTLWLAITYPQTFGACWSSSPDPVDFTRMQRPDIYAAANFYFEGDGTKEVASYRDTVGAVRMSNRQENLMEEVVGPDNTSGQQWDSWFAVWGPRNERGNPAALFDAKTGAIDRAVAERYRAFDIVELVRKSPGVLGPIFKQRVRLVVGDQDNFYLNEAVANLKSEVDKLSFFVLPEGGHGFLSIVPGMDHGTVFRSKEIGEFPKDMAEHLRRAGLVRE